MTTLNESVATQLREAADQVDNSATLDGGSDQYYDEGGGRVMVSIEAMNSLRRALNRCLGKSEFYAETKKWSNG